MSKASDQELSDLHGALAKTLREKLEDGSATSADMGIIRQFLKDNSIESLPGSGGALDKMALSLANFETEENYLHS